MRQIREFVLCRLLSRPAQSARIWRIFWGGSEASRGVQSFQENRLANPAECRKMAEECMRRAQAANASEVRAILISMARTWTALAVQAERLQTLTDRLGTNDGSS
jgi:hypothetical protein